MNYTEALELIKKGWSRISKKKFKRICDALGLKTEFREEFRYRYSPYVRYRLSHGNTYYVLRVYDRKGNILARLDTFPYGDTTFEGLLKLRSYLVGRRDVKLSELEPVYGKCDGITGWYITAEKMKKF